MLMSLMAVSLRVVAQNPPGSLPTPRVNGYDAVGDDPARIGVSVLLRNWTLHVPGTTIAAATPGQLDCLLNVAPRAPNGAIFHRGSQGGPCVHRAAYYACDQVRLYRGCAVRPERRALAAIALGDKAGPSYGGTGNAWAAAGALRVVATIKGSSAVSAVQSQQSDLVELVRRLVLDGTAGRVDVPLGRVSRGNDTYIPWAIDALELVRANLDDQGRLSDTVNPVTFSSPNPPGTYSPEGQSFVLLLEAAVAA
ncbi:hypothetical protein H4582DRAFT_2051970 [Lactarius indigo]|nr:hypothetical protein H4582DRAFT_2051970 [Lactarius indigo]